MSVACDVGDACQVDAAVARTLDAFGRMVAPNLTGVFLFSQVVGRVMIRRRAGNIVIMTGETVYVSGGPRVANREESAR